MVLGYPSAFVAFNETDMLRALVEKEVNPNVILMDYRLPRLNGMKVASVYTKSVRPPR